MLNKKLRFTDLKLIALCVILLLSACGGNDPYLYDRTGFDEGTRPVVAPNPRSPVQTPPDYYYRQPYQQPQAPYNPQQPAYAQPPAYQQPPVYAQPAPSRAYPQQYQNGGGSRYYSNPYAMPPQPGYSPYYDSDQYYAPPTTYYGNPESVDRAPSGAQGDSHY